MPKDADINYKNLGLLQKYINDRGKIVPRRVSGATAKQQRQLLLAIKRARFFGLLMPSERRSERSERPERFERPER